MEHHFIHYISSSNNLLPGFTPFGILIMLALWLLAIKSIFQSLKLYGALLTVVIIAAFIWGLQEYSIIDISQFEQVGWAATIGVGLLIWFGLNASIIWKKHRCVYYRYDGRRVRQVPYLSSSYLTRGSKIQYPKSTLKHIS